MPTPSLPRRAAAWSALTLTGTVFLGGPAVAAPTADISVHVLGAVAGAQPNQAKLCRFYLDATNFTPNQTVTWNIVPQAAVSATALPNTSLSGTLALPTGTAISANLVLPGGQYKLSWNVPGVTGAAKSKILSIHCSNTVGRPNGGPPAGAGGLARSEAFTPVVGAAAVGLAAVGTAVWFRLRRRSHGAA
ncbi:hypothetical protein [Streptomyces sp. CoH27]|uniref:hypothetical protein n=1 Tax=Streptomyces sp. CoH27 TaxID=2875763 RepID=UPI001CD7F552|nr:hypothetical protein [Streptomyces sp. CoH27]